jgi:YHS domain-containing protein
LFFTVSAVAWAAEVVNWRTEFDAARAEAQRTQRLLLVHFYGDHCPPCGVMTAEVFSRQDVSDSLEQNFVPVKIDSTKNIPLARQLGVRAIPCDVVLLPDGRIVERREGGIVAERYMEYLQLVSNEFLHRQPVQQFSPQRTETAIAQTTPPVAPPSTQPLTQQSTAPALNAAAIQPQVAAQFEPNGMTGTVVRQQPSDRPLIAPAPPQEVTPVSPFANAVTVQQPQVQQPTQAIQAIQTVPTTPTTSVAVVQSETAAPPVAANAAGLPLPASASVFSPAPVVGQQVATQSPIVTNQPITSPQGADAWAATVEIPLGLEGYCPVELSEHEHWVPGNPLYYGMYRGQIYRFSSEAALVSFDKDPARYAPIAGGDDIVLMVDRNKKQAGVRKFGAWYNNRVYLFAGQESFEAFSARPDYYAEIADKYETALRNHFDKIQR